MASAPWNPTFEAILQRGLPGLGKDGIPAADEPLERYELDSLALIGIVSELESAFGISLTGQVVIPRHMLTAGQLWDIVSAARPPSPGPQDPSPWAIA
ncbi:acyl carrier protein [Streptomyces sp. NPDC004542]|uniref:acyl carrier protein n=1 Tax=Streptomyces sp. NPDC004542 TaxID=3154281 RepID=UPI0033B6B334